MKSKLQIKSYFGNLLFEFECEDNTVKKTMEKAVKNKAYLAGADLAEADLAEADLAGADLAEADLAGAYLARANLAEAKNYFNSYDIFQEVVRRENIETFTDEEWSIIGKILVHRPCWGKIKEMFGKKIIPIGQKLAKSGFTEWAEHYKTL